jgi:galactokinase
MTDAETLAAGCRRHFVQQYGRQPDLSVAAPGRTNLIGEHTDYNEGHVLPVAIDRFLAASLAKRGDRRFRLYTVNLAEGFQYSADELPTQRPRWVSYIMGVAVELERAGIAIPGMDILVHGDIPLGSGLSSSAALEVAVATGLERALGFDLEDDRLVQVCRRADHNFVGINSGPMDQFASRACRAGHAGLLDCRSLVLTDVPLPKGLEFLSVYSGLPRALADSEYNERQNSCQQALSLLCRDNPEIGALRDASLEHVESCRSESDDRVYRRARHVVTEQSRVSDMTQALTEGDLGAIGRVLGEGHTSLSRDYEVSLPILDEMVDWLCQQKGVVGARLTGAGFGGSLVCVGEARVLDLESLSREFLTQFADSTPEPPEIWRLTSVDGAKYQPSLTSLP